MGSTPGIGRPADLPAGKEPAPATSAEVGRLSTRGVAVRVFGTVAALGVLAYGQVADTNDSFPFGTLSQFATARDLDGTVRSTYLLADTGQAEGTRIPMSMNAIGVGRAEVENQLDRILQHPALMQAVIDAYAALNPGEPRIEILYLMRSTQQLEDGYVVGEPEQTELLRWESTTGAGG